MKKYKWTIFGIKESNIGGYVKSVTAFEKCNELYARIRYEEGLKEKLKDEKDKLKDEKDKLISALAFALGSISDADRDSVVQKAYGAENARYCIISMGAGVTTTNIEV